MKNFAKFISENNYQDKSWLIVGKGPSFSAASQINFNDFYTIALNHVVCEKSVDFSHAIDIDVVLSCASCIYTNARFLITPLYPHVDNAPTERNILAFFDVCPELKKLDEEGRLLFYNSSTSANLDPNYPVIPVRYFSADAAVALLAYSGFKMIRTIGIDGGRKYSDTFSKLNHKTLLSNGQQSFDMQFQAIAKTIVKTGCTVLPVTMEGPINIFVGSQKEQTIAVKVLEYSIRKNSGISIDLLPLHLAPITTPKPKDPKNHPRTPFSFQRFLIPALCKYKGKAIYLDSDMLVFNSIIDLWNRDFGSSNILSTWINENSNRIPQFSVMLLNCEDLAWDIENIVDQLDNGDLTYEELMYSMKLARVDACIEPEWNSLEHYEEGQTKLIHYTDMNEQPWLKHGNRNGDLWIWQLKSAITDGHISMTEVVDSILLGEIRPSIYFELRKKDTFIKKYGKDKFTKVLHFIDKGFIPPHKRSKKDVSKFFPNRVRQTLVKYIISSSNNKARKKKNR